MTAKAQFAFKGAVSLSDSRLSDYVVTGQYYKDLLVLSGDVLIPVQKKGEFSYSGRIGLGFGNYRIRLAGDGVVTHKTKGWRLGYGAEVNLRLCGPVGIFARWSKTFPVSKGCKHHNEVLWKYGKSETTLGITIDLINNGRCY